MFAYIYLLYVLVSLLLIYIFIKIDCNPILAIYDLIWPNKKKLLNKTVWICGASTGIGEELAFQLAELNCKLILTGTNESKLQEVANECIKRSKNNLKKDDILVLAYDISHFDKNEIAFKQIIDKFGNIDILIANAARLHESKIEDDDFDQIKKLFEINLLSHILITKLVIKHWLKNGLKGQILATSSAAALCEMVFLSFYCGTKKALNAYMRDISMQHYGNGISVTICLPGPTESFLVDNKLSLKERQIDVDNFKKMSTKRCAHLMLVALANRFLETYIMQQPYLFGAYLYETCFGNYYACLLFRLFDLKGLVEKQFFRTIKN